MDKDSILIDLSESDKTAFGKEPFADQSVPQRVFSSIWAVESEVNNGGFCQYFQSSEAETATFVVQALETVGAPDTADICRRAITIAFPTGMPATPEAIAAAAEVIDASILEECDNQFLAYPHDLTELLFTYVSEHPEAFGTLPKNDA